MTRTLDAPELTLPPAYRALRAADAGGVAELARAQAAAHGAGALVWAEAPGRLVFAVTLEPAEPLAGARRAIYAGMTAFAQGLAALAAPERAVALVWPDTLTYDGARIGGGGLIWPDGCAEREAPDWLVFTAEALRDRADVMAPGRHPGSVSLAEEGLDAPGALVEAFARFLMLGFDAWAARGFEAVARDYLALAAPGPARRVAGNGDLIEGGARRDLVAALAERAWFDSTRGGVRL